MSHQNVEIVRRGFRGVRSDPDFDPKLFDADVEFDDSNAMLDGAVYRGPEGVREYLSLLREMWKQVRLERQDFIPVGEKAFQSKADALQAAADVSE